MARASLGSFDEHPEALLASVHGHCLRALSDSAGKPFVGLSMAARGCWKDGSISNRMYKKVVRVDTAFAIVRHLTTQRVQQFMVDLGNELQLMGFKKHMSLEEYVDRKKHTCLEGQASQECSTSGGDSSTCHSWSAAHAPSIRDS